MDKTKKSKKLYYNYNEYLQTISNGNRTEWSTIQGVIGRVISNRAWPILNYEPDYP